MKPEVILDVLISTIGGRENFRIHTDGHIHNHKVKLEQCLSCGHFGQAFLNPSAYGLEKEDVNFISGALQQLKLERVMDNILDGEHLEQGVIILKSQNYSIAPKTKKGDKVNECFIYHKTLDDRRRRLLAENLLPHIMTEKDIDAEYVYEILTTISDQQLFETVERIAPEYPIYNVDISDEGEVEIKD